MNDSQKAYDGLNTQFCELSQELKESNSLKELLRRENDNLEVRSWRTKWWLSGIIAVLVIGMCAFFGISYFAGQEQLAAPSSLSAESRAAFDRLPAEQKKMVNQVIRAEQQVISQPNPFAGRSEESSIDRFVSFSVTHLIAVLIGFCGLPIYYIFSILKRAT